MRRSQVTDIFERWKEDISTEPGSRENTKKDLINKFLFASDPLISIFEQTAHYNMRLFVFVLNPRSDASARDVSNEE